MMYVLGQKTQHAVFGLAEYRTGHYAIRPRPDPPSQRKGGLSLH